MNSLLEYLNSIYPLSESLREHLSNILKEKHIQKREFLLKEGNISRNIYYIQKGLLRAFYLNNQGQVSSWFMKEGDIIVSILSFYQQVPSFESIQAIENTELLYISFKELENVYRTFIEFNYIGRELTIKYLIFWAWQLYSIRNQTATQRYHWLMANNPEIVLRVPAKFIASYLDITEVTLSKIKNKMRNKTK